MMGVYVKGMEMPENCCDCLLSEESTFLQGMGNIVHCGWVCGVIHEPISEQGFYSGRLLKCPIFEVQKNELKPCPFCGSDAVINEKRDLLTWIVECSNTSCPASYMIGMDYDTKEEAIEAWNRRANDEHCNGNKNL